ncbi:MAG: hypothetical protein JNJ63_09030 [Hyphomonadaceae bacterium]|nr:hypothetical protein [Hyphomonadaceae bacterium]
MGSISAQLDLLADRASDLWFLALVGSFFVMICEAAKPKRAEGEAREATGALGVWIGILSLLTPLLLFVHAFLTAQGSLIAIIVLIGAAIIGASLIGWIISAAAKDFGRVLNRAAPILALAVFALTLYVTWDSVFAFIGIFVGRR